LNNEQRYFDALKRITKYMTVEQLRKRSEKEYGLDFTEALGYAYENVIDEARGAIFGRRRPKVKIPQTAPTVPENAAPEAK